MSSDWSDPYKIQYLTDKIHEKHKIQQEIHRLLIEQHHRKEQRQSIMLGIVSVIMVIGIILLWIYQ